MALHLAKFVDKGVVKGSPVAAKVPMMLWLWWYPLAVVLTSRGAVVDWWWCCPSELLLPVSMLLRCYCERRLQHDAPAFFNGDLSYSTCYMHVFVEMREAPLI